MIIFMSRLRNKIFWIVDNIKGNLVGNSYREIKKIDQLDYYDKYIHDYHDNRISRLIEHTTTTTRYYNKFKSKTVISDFPVINKNIIRNNRDAFLSEIFDKKNLFQMATSGSTGTPFICYQDKVKKRRVNAEIIYYSEKVGYSVGRNLIFLRAMTNKSKKTKLQQWIQNETLINISELDDTKIEKILTNIVEISKNGSTILAYASTYDALKDYFLRYGNDLVKEANIVGMISSSEMLYDETRNIMKEAFNCKVFSRYSNQENGVIGQDENNNNVFLLNEANYIVEILDFEVDMPVPDGKVGRIVITDLYNFAMPMIRYDTGDIGSIVQVISNGKVKRAISNFGGRKIDVVYDSCGNRLSPHIITNNFWEFSEIKQFQFIQKDKKTYLIKINIHNGFDKIDKIEFMLKRLLGEDANITVEIVSDMPELASGKRKYVVNEINQK